MTRLRRLPDGLGLYQAHDVAPWAVGEVRAVDDVVAARLLSQSPCRFEVEAAEMTTPAAPSMTRAPASSAPVSSGAALDVDALSFRDLQRACKAAGVSAAGTTAELRARLRGVTG